MKGRYDDLSQEMWGVADDDIPQDYLKAIVAQTLPKSKPLHDPDNFWERLKIAEMAREYAKFHPREGQPDEENPFIFQMSKWYKEGLRRAKEIPYFPYRLA